MQTPQTKSLVLVPTQDIVPAIPKAFNLLALTAEIVSAHVVHNRVPIDELPQLIKNVHASLSNVANPKQIVLLRPALPIKESVTADQIVCLECGAHLLMIKRHLMTSHKLTTTEYRKRWNLPPTYPLTAPNYSKKREKIAKKIGLGHMPGRYKGGRKRR